MLNRARNASSITTILGEKNQFQSVTGVRNSGPSNNYTGGPSLSRAERIYNALINILPVVDKRINCFTAANPAAYGAGTNIGFLYKLKSQPSSVNIGGNKGTVFAIC